MTTPSARYFTRCFLICAAATTADGSFHLREAGVGLVEFAQMPPERRLTVALALQHEGHHGPLSTSLALVAPDGVALRHDRFLDPVDPSPNPAPRMHRWAHDMNLEDVTTGGVYTLLWFVEGNEQERQQFVIEHQPG